MSSLLANLEMSLDDIISQKKNARKNPDARPVRREGGNTSSFGPIRNKNRRAHRRGAGQPYARRVEEEEMMDVEADTSNGNRAAAKRKAKQPGNKKVSILSRLGGKAEKPTLGTKILVKNLKHDILEDDVKELFGTVGKVNQVEIVYDASGRSKGIARVWFLKAMDAEKAVKQYDGRTLDGQAMTIILDEKNVRSGLFGTALEAGRDNDKVQFKVNLGGNNGPSKGRHGGRGGGRRRDGGSKTTQDLDNEMDTYMNDA